MPACAHARVLSAHDKKKVGHHCSRLWHPWKFIAFTILTKPESYCCSTSSSPLGHVYGMVIHEKSKVCLECHNAFLTKVPYGGYTLFSPISTSQSPPLSGMYVTWNLHELHQKDLLSPSLFNLILASLIRPIIKKNWNWIKKNPLHAAIIYIQCQSLLSLLI